MPIPVISNPLRDLARLGLNFTERSHYQLTADQLIRDCLRRTEGIMSDQDALVIRTGEFTGRSPKDRYLVQDENYAQNIDWNDFNQPLSEQHFDIIQRRLITYLNKLPEVWIRDCYACADMRYRLNIRVVNERPSSNLFAHNMFLRPSTEEIENNQPDWHLLSAPGLRLDPAECGTRQHNAVVISFKHRMILIAGTGYTGETKKAIFTILNYLLPQKKNVLSMHCSANIGINQDTAIFFGLSGTGKTTLSTAPNRNLIGDDEHGWTNKGIFNFEGGCYAKCIHLKEESEPQIYQAIYGPALVENVVFFPHSNRINFDDGSITENTRVSYPLDHIEGIPKPSIGDHPKNIFFLTCDAYGVLPPVSRLTVEQAMYQFISGYTAKVAGTETGIKEPKSTFSTCFGAPFMPLHPGRYASMLGKRMTEHHAKVWLVNTGWTGGAYGVGKRISLNYTRAMINAALEGHLDHVEYENHPVFGMAMPKSCPGVPPELLDPSKTWADPKSYAEKSRELACQFIRNFEQYKTAVSAEILAGGPKI
jgi:phosphoenolpyruvate carboxykinase (ATP)